MVMQALDCLNTEGILIIREDVTYLGEVDHLKLPDFRNTMDEVPCSEIKIKLGKKYIEHASKLYPSIDRKFFAERAIHSYICEVTK